MENVFIKKICFRVRKIKKCPEGWVLGSARGNKETDEDRVVFISNKYYTGKIPPFFKWPWQKLYLEFEQVDGFMLSAKINNKTLFTVASENLPPEIKVKLEKGEKLLQEAKAHYEQLDKDIKDALEKVIRKREGEKHVDKIESLVIRGVNTYRTEHGIDSGTWIPIEFRSGSYTYGNTYNDMFGVTPLMMAAAMKYNDILEALIAAGADIDLEEKPTRDSEYNGRQVVGHTALSYAILAGNLEGALMLINAGADVHKKDFYLYNAVGTDNIKMVRLLIEKGCDVNEIPSFSDTTILQTAVKKANADMVKLLLLNKINIHNRKDDLLYYAISSYGYRTYKTDVDERNRKNVLTIIRLLLDAGVDIDIRTSIGGTTPLIEACKEGYTDIVKLLIEYGADVNYSDKYGKKPLKVAKKNDIVRVLIDAGAEE